MLCREIIAVCFQLHTKPLNKMQVQDARLLGVKLGGKRNCKFFPVRTSQRQTGIPNFQQLLHYLLLQDKHWPLNG